MRKTIIAICGAVALSGCGIKNMAKVADCPDIGGITPPAGKAALVIAEVMRVENYDLEDNPHIRNYLDRKFIGATRDHTLFVSTVEPGNHYIVANGENFETILLNFKPGKTYYLEQEIRSGIALPRTRYTLVKADRLLNDLREKYTCYQVDPRSTVRDMDEQTFAEAVAAYTRENGKIPVNEVEPGK